MVTLKGEGVPVFDKFGHCFHPCQMLDQLFYVTVDSCPPNVIAGHSLNFDFKMACEVRLTAVGVNILRFHNYNSPHDASMMDDEFVSSSVKGYKSSGNVSDKPCMVASNT